MSSFVSNKRRKKVWGEQSTTDTCYNLERIKAQCDWHYVTAKGRSQTVHDCFVPFEWQGTALRLNVSFWVPGIFSRCLADLDSGLMSDGCIFRPLSMARENTHLAIALLAGKLFRSNSSKQPITRPSLIDGAHPSIRTSCICFHLLGLCGTFCLWATWNTA